MHILKRMGLSAWSSKPNHIFRAKFPPHFHATPFFAGSWDAAVNIPFSLTDCVDKRSASGINLPAGTSLELKELG